MNEKHAGPGADPTSGLSIEDTLQLLSNCHSMKTSSDIGQFSYAEKLAALTCLYCHLGLPALDALQAAEADL